MIFHRSFFCLKFFGNRLFVSAAKCFFPTLPTLFLVVVWSFVTNKGEHLRHPLTPPFHSAHRFRRKICFSTFDSGQPFRTLCSRCTSIFNQNIMPPFYATHPSAPKFHKLFTLQTPMSSRLQNLNI